MLYLAILATVLFLASSWWMVRDTYRAWGALDRPTVLSVMAFFATAEAMALLWLAWGWNGK